MGFKFYNPSYPKEKVTMRMLLTHTSGLIDRDGEFSNKLKSITHNSNFYVSPPGVKFLYCNLGMGIAGAVVEKAADQTISQYAKDKFLEPMGLDASYDAKYLSDSSLVAECYAGGNVNCSNKLRESLTAYPLPMQGVFNLLLDSIQRTIDLLARDVYLVTHLHKQRSIH